MKTPIKVVMLSTEDITHVKIGKHTKQLLYITEKINGHNSWINQHLYITVPQDIEPIKEGNWFIHNNRIVALCTGIDDDGTTINFTDSHGFSNGLLTPSLNRKIITTTDPKLKLYEAETLASASGFSLKTDDILLPQVQQSFLKEFVANPKGEWEVEYEDLFKYYPKTKVGQQLKINQDNTVNITSVNKDLGSLLREYLDKEGRLWDFNNFLESKGIDPSGFY